MLHLMQFRLFGEVVAEQAAHVLDEPVELRSRIMNLTWCACSPRSMIRFWAC